MNTILAKVLRPLGYDPQPQPRSNVTVRFTHRTPADKLPTVLEGAVRAVLADVYRPADADGLGGVLTEDIRCQDARPVYSFPVGTELYIESNSSLSTSPELADATRIWWRAVVTG